MSDQVTPIDSAQPQCVPLPQPKPSRWYDGTALKFQGYIILAMAGVCLVLGVLLTWLGYSSLLQETRPTVIGPILLVIGVVVLCFGLWRVLRGSLICRKYKDSPHKHFSFVAVPTDSLHEGPKDHIPRLQHANVFHNRPVVISNAPAITDLEALEDLALDDTASVASKKYAMDSERASTSHWGSVYSTSRPTSEVDSQADSEEEEEEEDQPTRAAQDIEYAPTVHAQPTEEEEDEEEEEEPAGAVALPLLARRADVPPPLNLQAPPPPTRPTESVPDSAAWASDIEESLASAYSHSELYSPRFFSRDYLPNEDEQAPPPYAEIAEVDEPSGTAV